MRWILLGLAVWVTLTLLQVGMVILFAKIDGKTICWGCKSYYTKEKP